MSNNMSDMVATIDWKNTNTKIAENTYEDGRKETQLNSSPP